MTRNRTAVTLAIMGIVALAPESACKEGPSMVFAANLRLEHPPTQLPLVAQQLFAVALDDRLHVIAKDPAGRVRHIVVDAQGKVVPLGDLAMAGPAGVTACGGAIFVSGWTAASAPVVVRIAADGTAGSAVDIAAAPPLHVWPRPVCIARAPWLVWTSGDPAAVHIAPAGGGATQTIAFADPTDQLDALGDDGGLWLARLHGSDGRLALARIESGKVVVERDVPATHPTAPSLAPVRDGVALSWIETPSRVRAQRFDAGARPDPRAATLDSSTRDGPFDSARLLVAGDGALAILASSRAVLGDARTVSRADGTRVDVAPRHATHLRVVAYDARAGQLGLRHAIEPDQPVHAAAWVAGSLWVVHAGNDAQVQLSVFARTAPPP